MKRLVRRLPSLLGLGLAGSLLVLAAACGGSSGGAVAGAINFTYAPASGSSPSVSTELGAGSDSSVAVIEIHVTDVNDVLGAGFTLDFDPNVVGYLDFDVMGSHLASDGEALQPFAQSTRPGQVTVGVTRLAMTGVDFAGRRLLMRVRFLRTAAAGTSPLAFGSNDLLDSMTPPQPIPGVQWFGGTFQVD